MAPNVKIALGSKGGFLGKDELLKEVTKDTPTGKKIIETISKERQKEIENEKNRLYKEL